MAKRLKSVAGTLADPTIEFIPLEIDGRTYRLGYNYNVIAEAEDLVPGINLLQGIAAILLNNMNTRQLRALLYAAVRAGDPEFTLEEAGRLIRIDTMPDIVNGLLQCYNASVPEEKKILAHPTSAGGGAGEGSPTEKSGNDRGPRPESP